MKNKTKILAATHNPVSQTKLFTVMVDIPYVLLPELLQCKELNINYKKIEDIILEEVLDNCYIPFWTKKQKSMNGEMFDEEIIIEMWKQFLKGCISQMTIEINHNSTISQVCFDIHSPESSGWIVDYKKLGIVDMYEYLLKQQVHKQHANILLTPFAYTTCIISGTEWDLFFELFCPKYTTKENKIYKSKKSFKIGEDVDSPNIDFEWFFDLNSINKSTIQQELQIIAEQIYDLYREVFWEEREIHIPFEEDIQRKYDVYGWRLEATKSDWAKIPDIEMIGDSEIIKMVISSSMCYNILNNIDDTDWTLNEHLDNIKRDYTHVAIPMLEGEYKYWSVSKIKDHEEFFQRYNSYHGEKKEEGVISKELGWCDNLRGFKKYK